MVLAGPLTQGGTPPGTAHLRDVLAAAPGSLLTLLVAPRGDAVEVRFTVVLDVTESRLAPGAGALLLMVGVRPDSPVALRVLREAAAAGYVGVVVKRRGASLQGLVTVASEVGIAVLEAAEEAPWRALDALVASILGSRDVETALDRGTSADQLFAVANSVAAVFGGAVALEDLERRILAYSTLPGQEIDQLRIDGILARRVPDTPNNRWQYQQVISHPGVVRFPADWGELARSAVAVRAGAVPLGTLWAIEGADAHPDAEVRDRALLDAARVSAVHVLRLHHADELAELARGETLAALLEGRASAAQVAARLALPPGPVVLLACVPRDPDDATVTAAVAAAAARQLAALATGAAVAVSPQQVHVLLPGTSGEGARRLANSVVDAVRRSMSSELRVAVSSAGTGLDDVPALLAEVSDTLRAVVRAPSAGSVVELRDVLAGAVLDRLADVLDRSPQLRHPGLVRLQAHDARRRTALATTLLAWLEVQGDVVRAGQRLTVHPNTVRYRLRRAAEVAGVDLDDADTRLSLWLQLRASGG